MLALILAVLVWLGLHAVVPATVRPALVARFGLQRYIPVFAMSSLAAMTGMVLAYREAPYVALWPPLPGGSLVVPLLVAAAFQLVALGVTAINPATPAGEAMGGAPLPTLGVVRITRHPVLAGIALWAAGHLLVNGHLAALLLFGTLLFTAVNGMASIDRHRRKALGPAWDGFAARTSRLPFAAIAAGRNAWTPGEVPWRPAAAGLAVFVGVYAAHLWLFGVPPWLP